MISEIAKEIAKGIDEYYNKILEPYGIHITPENCRDYVGRLEIKKGCYDDYGLPHSEDIILDGKVIHTDMIEYGTPEVIENDECIKVEWNVKRLSLEETKPVIEE